MATPNRYGHYSTRARTPAAAAPVDAGYRARVARRAAAASHVATPGLPTGPAAASDQGFVFNGGGAGGFPVPSLVAGDGSYGYALETSTYGLPGDDANPLNVGNFYGDNSFDPFSPAPSLSGDTSGSFGTPTPASTIAGDVPAAAPWHYRRALKNYGPGGTAPTPAAAGGALGADPATTGIRYRAKRVVAGWAGFSQTKKYVVGAAAVVGVLVLIAYRRPIVAKFKTG